MMEDGNQPHVPVLARQVMEILQPRTGQIFLDLTVGYAGHAHSILSAIGREGKLIGIDLDGTALKAAKIRLERFGDSFIPVHANFASAPGVLVEIGISQVDGILMDLGVSSPQLADPARGFSFATDAPLDMRMDTSVPSPTAEEIVNERSESELADVIWRYGEERHARRIARWIVQRRRERRIRTTGELAGIVKRAYPRGHFRIHPATRTFQALRIEVNGELDNLKEALDQAPGLLRENGRMAVISFHSLEDRLVKQAFRHEARRGRMRILTRKPLTADEDEMRDNPRARSAKLRGAQRTAGEPAEDVAEAGGW